MDTFYTVIAELGLSHLRDNLFELGIAFADRWSETNNMRDSDRKAAVERLAAIRLIINNHVSLKREQHMYVAQSLSVYMTACKLIQERLDHVKRHTEEACEQVDKPV